MAEENQARAPASSDAPRITSSQHPDRAQARAARGPRPAAVPADAASFSAARRCANSAPRRSTGFLTATCGCCGQFVAERGKIVPRRLSGVCTTHQRRLTRPSSRRGTLRCCRLPPGTKLGVAYQSRSSRFASGAWLQPCRNRLRIRDRLKARRARLAGSQPQPTSRMRFGEFLMEVILKEDVADLGFRGEVVKVADGYARNYLLPRKMAMQATAANKAVIEQMKAAAARRSASEKAQAEATRRTSSSPCAQLYAQVRRGRPSVWLRHFG